MKYKINELVPVGTDGSKTKKTFLLLYSAAVVFSAVIYCINLFDSLALLYYNDVNGQRQLYENVYMEEFSVLRSGVFYVFLILLALLIACIIYNFLLHYQGSKSIFTMRRVPDKLELYRRCISLPLIFIVLILVSIAVLNFVYYFFYILVTPEKCLLPDWKTMWRF